MLKLSDDEMDAILRAAGPIDVDRRGAFLEAVAGELAGRTEVGEGVVFRICRDLPRAGRSPGQRWRARWAASFLWLEPQPAGPASRAPLEGLVLHRYDVLPVQGEDRQCRRR
jgi:hypothetical protein